MFENIFNISKKDALDLFFYPRSIAVIGASNEQNKIGAYIFSEILKKNNIKAYPINVKWEEIQGVKAYQNILNIKESVDLAIIAIPALNVIEAVNDCVKKGIKNIVIISAGFKEIGRSDLEDELKEIISKNSLKIIGPNCLGFLNVENSLNCSFAKDIPNLGTNALISQSGAVIDALIDWSFKENIGFSKIVSLGNMAGVDEIEILKYLKDDLKTNSIICYMETIQKGKEFGKLIREISIKKPIVIIKPGNSENAKKAIGSHTGSLAQDNLLVKTLIKENNGILVENLNELYNVLIALKSKRVKNNKLVILTNAGGPGVIASDLIDNSAFELYKFSEEQKEKFDFLAAESSLNNPIDILGDAKSERYINTLKELEKIEDIGNILVLLTPQIMTDSTNIAKELIEFSKNSKKSVFSCFLGNKEIKEALELFSKENFSNFQSPFEALKAMSYLYNYENFDYEDIVPEYPFNKNIIENLQNKLNEKKGLLDYEISKEIIENVFAIKMPQKEIIRKKEDILSININKNKKYILKVDSNEIIHKKDIGGILFNIDSSNLIEKSNEMFEKMLKITENFTLTLEEEIVGREIILGFKNDFNLGKFIIFGMGGTYVNIINDINVGICPLNKKSVEKLVKNTKIYTALKEFRGENSINFELLYEVMLRLSQIQFIFPQIKEIDLNPIICNENGINLVDVKFIL